MKSKNLIYLLAIILALHSCSKTPGETRLNSFEIPTVTGFVFKNEEGVSMGSYGGPVNNKISDKGSGQESSYYLNVFPNPSNDFYSVYTKVPSPSIMKHIWIVQATYNGELSNTEINNNAVNLVAGGAPLIEVNSQSEIVRINISSLNEGYYRIYMEAGDIILYDNLIVYKGNGSFFE
ncbi:MAG: hypothetical protein GQ527_00375 [Bacteroidales bacterium]|nr:hypothetical protein [Bacteroidales bacterium]